MILHRFSRAVRKQDWFTVVLEILIVIVGIFLGLQVDDWNESRKFRQQEAVYLSKIADDLEAMQSELLNRVERYDESVQTMIAALNALETCDTSDAATSDVKFAMERYQSAPPINYLDATYDEMVASGALARIRDEGLKRKIASTFSTLSALNTSVRGFRISIPVVDAIVWERVSYSVDRDTGRQVASFDMAEICHDTMVRNAVVEMIDIQSDSSTGAVRALQSVEELLGLLGVNLGSV